MADLGAIAINSLRTGVVYGGMISGTVRDSAGNPTARYIRAYNTLTGQLSGGAKSDPATGNYVLPTSSAGGLEEHFVVEMHPDGSENHRIRGFVTPNKGY